MTRPKKLRLTVELDAVPAPQELLDLYETVKDDPDRGPVMIGTARDGQNLLIIRTLDAPHVAIVGVEIVEKRARKAKP